MGYKSIQKVYTKLLTLFKILDSILKRKNFKVKPKTDDDVGGELDSDLVALANFGGGSFNAQLRQANLIKTDKPSRYF